MWTNQAITLEYKQAIELFPTAPFNFDATIHKPDHFPSTDNFWEPGARWQTMLWQRTPLGLKLENLGTVDQPKVLLNVWSQYPLAQDFQESLIQEITYRYNLQMDLSEFNQRFSTDPVLGPILVQWRGMRPVNFNSLYEYLVIAIALQNATVHRSVNMLQALFENYGNRLVFDGRKLSGFWEPEVIHQATEEDLRRLKVGYRAKSIKRVTEVFTKSCFSMLLLMSPYIPARFCHTSKNASANTGRLLSTISGKICSGKERMRGSNGWRN